MKTSWQDVFKTFLQDALKTSWQEVLNKSWKRMTKMNVFVSVKTSWRSLEDFFWRCMTKANIVVLIKTLRSLFVGKSFHHLCGSRHFTKQNWFPSVATEINFYWPKLRNRHGVVFSCLLQFLYKNTEQNWHILCSSFLLGTCGRPLLTISVVKVACVVKIKLFFYGLILL